MKHLIGVTVCVNYLDYFTHTIDRMLEVVDKLYVITSPQDKETIDFVQGKGSEKIEVYRYYSFYKRAPDGRKARFNKSGAIREVQAQIYLRSNCIAIGDNPSPVWVLLIDSDILLPERARKELNEQCTNYNMLYGAKRIDYHTRESFLQGVGQAYKHDYAGFFQLYNRPYYYPEYSSNCSRCDVLFYQQFSKRQVLGMTVSHLGKDHVNWDGRKSPKW